MHKATWRFFLFCQPFSTSLHKHSSSLQHKVETKTPYVQCLMASSWLIDCSQLSRVSSGNHCRSDPVRVQSTINKLAWPLEHIIVFDINSVRHGTNMIFWLELHLSYLKNSATWLLLYSIIDAIAIYVIVAVLGWCKDNNYRRATHKEGLHRHGHSFQQENDQNGSWTFCPSATKVEGHDSLSLRKGQ